jgi:thiol-disulfide isomerase/thioredoxin
MTFRCAIPSLALGLCLLAASPGRAQTTAGDFGRREIAPVLVPPFADRELADLIGLFEQRLDASAADTGVAPGPIFDGFIRKLQTVRLTAAQEARVASRLDAIGRARPALAPLVARTQRLLRGFTVGKTAPDIAGVDLDGVPFRLRDYRGKVVVLAFSGEWCGICRTEYPYQRLLLDLYRNWPFALISVESGKDLATARQAKADARLLHRSFWDGGGRPGDGPIASAWAVTGWPTVYVIDARGVIQFVDVRQEDLLKAVRQLLTDTTPGSGPRPSSPTSR